MYAERTGTAPVAGSYDSADYRACLKDLFKEMAKKGPLLSKVPTLLKPAGGQVVRGRSRGLAYFSYHSLVGKGWTCNS